MDKKHSNCTSHAVPVNESFEGTCDGTTHTLFEVVTGPTPTAAVIRFTNNATASISCPVTFTVIEEDGTRTPITVAGGENTNGRSPLFSFGHVQSITATCPRSEEPRICIGGVEGTFFFCICCDDRDNRENDDD